ncbi:MAG: GNAT family N-acetyltransferase [Planctomycetes bacterium]|nr:GNAT family N-acetyltransferase [Planctomycetota bacterium]
MTSGNDEIEIRQMRPDEQETVVQLVLDTFAEVSVAKNITDRFGSINGRTWQEMKTKTTGEDVAGSDVVLVGESGGEVVAMLTITYERSNSVGHIVHLAVARSTQGRGLGRRMVREALARMKSDGLKYARIEALDQNPRARSLYESEGFEEIGLQHLLFRAL